jgi:coproporphyrinogen III oxidase
LYFGVILGCNISIANMKLPFRACASMAEDHKQLKELIESKQYKDTELVQRFTASISLVFHPISPFMPTVHANYRYFEFLLPDGKKIHWFGGGSDLTPTYINKPEASYFHRQLQSICNQHNKEYYPRFKLWCDKYFYNPLRGETRGVGGIFFDDLYENFDQNKQFVFDCARGFNGTYFPLILRNFEKQWTVEQFEFEQIRRSRYVEFNLLFDKGTQFGFKQPNARPEAILMSLPPTARWVYKYEPQPNSPEEETLNILKNPQKQNWAD